MSTNRRPLIQIKPNLLDRVVNYVNPVTGMNRIRARASYQALNSSGYITTGTSRRSMRGWGTSAQSADADTIPKLENMRADSRDLFMTAPIATGLLRRARTSIVGYGLSLQARIDRQVLNLSNEQAEAWEHLVEREFNMWARSKDADASRTQNFYDMQGMALLAVLLSGDCFCLLPYIPRPNMPYDLRVKILEADFVSNPLGSMDTEKIAGGVEVDGDGAPIRYYVRNSHPGGLDLSSGLTWSSIEAYGSKTGRRNILHLFNRERPGQRRGIPLLTPVIESLKQISRLSEAELMASVVTAFFTAFIKSNTPQTPLGDSYTADEKVTDPSNVTSDQNLVELGHGSIVGLAPGEEIVIADPKRPNQAFEPFFNSIVKQIGCAVEMPYELIMLNFTASYSASRGALLEAWKFFNSGRTWLERELCRPVYEEVLTEGILKGRISAPGFFGDPILREAWCGCKWCGPGQGQLNPEVETNAAILRINNNLSTHTKETAMIDGDDWDSMVLARSREQRIIEENRLTPVSATPASTTPKPAPTNRPDNKDLSDTENKPNQQPEDDDE